MARERKKIPARSQIMRKTCKFETNFFPNLDVAIFRANKIRRKNICMLVIYVAKYRLLYSKWKSIFHLLYLEAELPRSPESYLSQGPLNMAQEREREM